MAPTTNHVFRTVEGKVEKAPTEIPTLKPNEVLLKITHSGLCHSDFPYMDSGIALGHEGVGVVEAIGSAVTTLRVGDRAGGGYHRNSCGKCKYCLTGQDIWCYSRDIYGEASFNTGTHGDYYVGVETYLHKIPDEISSEDAAPLQCAGATVYDALVSVVKPGLRVGVLGIGGLGHLAIQFADKMGAEVIVFSTSQSKEAEAKGFGAKEFYLLDEPEKITSPVDILILTGSKYPDFTKFLTKEIFARTGTIVPLTASPNQSLDLPALSMFFHGYNVHSSLVASRNSHDDMLRFAALHRIKPAVELFPLNDEGWKEAVDRLQSGKMRYRAVLVNERI